MSACTLTSNKEGASTKKMLFPLFITQTSEPENLFLCFLRRLFRCESRKKRGKQTVLLCYFIIISSQFFFRYFPETVYWRWKKKTKQEKYYFPLPLYEFLRLLSFCCWWKGRRLSLLDYSIPIAYTKTKLLAHFIPTSDFFLHFACLLVTALKHFSPHPPAKKAYSNISSKDGEKFVAESFSWTVNLHKKTHTFESKSKKSLEACFGFLKLTAIFIKHKKSCFEN